MGFSPQDPTHTASLPHIQHLNTTPQTSGELDRMLMFQRTGFEQGTHVLWYLEVFRRQDQV